MAEPLLAVDGLAAGYGATEILRGLSMSVAPGEIVAVLGSNGVGKTTLNMALSGIVRARRGRISFLGEDITGASPADIVARGLIHVPEGRKIFPGMAVRENLELGSYRRGKAARAANLERVFAIFPRLKDRTAQLAGTLSGGEQQMLAIGRGLMAEPKLLILDEPSLGLSPLLVEEMFTLVRRINAEGLAVLLVEQNVVQSLEIASRAFILENGAFALQGDARELAASDELRRAYDTAGFNRALVERGLKVPHADLWTPTRDELTAAGVVTGYVDGGRFSASGWGVSVTPATVREEFRKSSPVYAALERSQPGQARELYARVAKLYGRGATSDELFGLVSLRVHELVQPRFANAPDGPILQFGRAMARQFAELRSKDPGMCWQVMRAGSTPAVTALLSEAAQRDERDALVAILQSPATGRTLSKSGQARVMVALRRIVEGRITPAQFALLDRPEIAPADRPDYCVAIAAILDGILQLPERDAAGLLRTFLGQNN